MLAVERGKERASDNKLLNHGVAFGEIVLLGLGASMGTLSLMEILIWLG